MSAPPVSAAELLDTIRRAINDWHALYHKDTGRSVEPPVYLSSLANDIAHVNRDFAENGGVRQ